MLLNEIRDHKRATHSRKRVGRGIGSGLGKTAGRGHKGQKSRSGVSLLGFEGGQMPLYRRLPKRGFNNPFKPRYAIVNTGRIQTFIDNGKLDSSKPITAEVLKTSGLFNRMWDGVRLLAKGDLKTKITIEVSGFSVKAKEMVEAKGGVVTIVEEKTSTPEAKPMEKPKAVKKPAARTKKDSAQKKTPSKKQ